VEEDKIMAKDQYDQYDERYLMEKGQDFEGKAHPGTPLEPDELEESPPEFQSATQGPRKEGEQPEAHPTSELSSLPKRSPGKASSGKHPTDELAVKPRARR
jgi:hypothetical protein